VGSTLTKREIVKTLPALALVVAAAGGVGGLLFDLVARHNWKRGK
jgi:hypothetical protein